MSDCVGKEYEPEKAAEGLHFGGELRIGPTARHQNHARVVDHTASCRTFHKGERLLKEMPGFKAGEAG